jgi:hypothetical protein
MTFERVRGANLHCATLSEISQSAQIPPQVLIWSEVRLRMTMCALAPNLVMEVIGGTGSPGDRDEADAAFHSAKKSDFQASSHPLLTIYVDTFEDSEGCRRSSLTPKLAEFALPIGRCPPRSSAAHWR